MDFNLTEGILLDSVVTNLRGFVLNFECNVFFWVSCYILNSFVGMVGDCVFMFYVIRLCHMPPTIKYSCWKSFHSTEPGYGSSYSGALYFDVWIFSYRHWIKRVGRLLHILALAVICVRLPQYSCVMVDNAVDIKY